MEIRGVFFQKGEVKTFESGFKSQEFYADCKRFNQYTGEAYENILKFQASRSGVLDLLATLKKGDVLNISFSPQGRIYDKKDGSGKGHAQNLDVWKVEILQSESKPKETVTTATPPESSTDPIGIGEDDELPF